MPLRELRIVFVT